MDIYCIRRNPKCILKNCIPKCHRCNICIHDFTCQCYDFCRSIIICKHIHFIQLFHDTNPSEIHQLKIVENIFNEHSYINRKHNTNLFLVNQTENDKILHNKLKHQ